MMETKNEVGFSKDFLWGAASAAAQVEGAYNEDGKGLSIWDCASDKKLKRSENCHIACDHYHRYKEDVALMKQIGLKSYRFSVSWPRIMPEKGKVNQKGIAFYCNLVKELRKAGIEPLCTLYHWDLPMWVYKEGGWKNSKTVGWFAEYVKVVVEALSEDVQYWMTFNEPQMFIGQGYITGIHAPFKKSIPSIFKLSKNVLLAHGKAVQTIRQYAKTEPKVGMALAASAFIPKGEGNEAVQWAYENTFSEKPAMFGNAWWTEPMIVGKAPQMLKRTLKEKDLQQIAQPLDFVGLNVYQPFNYDCGWAEGEKSIPGMPRNTIGWPIAGDTLYWTVRFFYEKYHLPILITENGMANTDFVMLDGKVHDTQRIDFMKRYLKGLKRAASEGIPVIGYQHWSIMDNYEWAEGYDPRFGLIYVDYATQERILKDSAYFYAEIIKTNGVNL